MMMNRLTDGFRGTPSSNKPIITSFGFASTSPEEDLEVTSDSKGLSDMYYWTKSCRLNIAGEALIADDAWKKDFTNSDFVHPKYVYWEDLADIMAEFQDNHKP